MNINVEAKMRTESVDSIRKSGNIPAVLYGPEIDSVSLFLNAVAFQKLYEEVGESTLLDFSVDGKEAVKVLVQDVQYHPVKRHVLHVDFRQINMSEEMEVTTPLVFIGVSPAVKEHGGTLVTSLEEVNIKCLPKDLVSEIEVSLEVLKTFDDKISVEDLILPPGIVVTDDKDIAVATVTAPLTDDQLKAMEAENARGLEAVAVVEKVKTEDAEGEVKKDGEKKDEKKKEDKKK